MKNGRKYKLLCVAVSLLVGGVCAGAGIRMVHDGYVSGWFFAALGALLAAVVFLLGCAVVRYVGGGEPTKTDADAPETPPDDEGLQHLPAMGLRISKEDYQKVRRRIAEENDKTH